MAAKLLRLVYVFEFLLALIAIFVIWPGVGGQSVLDEMHWTWKAGLGTALAVSIVAFSAAFVAGESWLTLRSAGWLAAIAALLVGMGSVTYYYAQLEDNADTEDSSTISLQIRPSFSDTLRCSR